MADYEWRNAGRPRTLASNAMHDELLKEFREFAATAPDANALMERIAHRLHESQTRYNWVGFYFIDPADPDVLRLGPYVGSFTPHDRISLSVGLCGAAASSGKTVVVHDVSQDPRYLSGSAMVKCEIVVPIFAKGKLAGELDINSYFGGTFSQAEQDFIEACAAEVGKYLGKK